MDELIKQLVEKVGLDEAMAQKVVAFLKENASSLPAMLGGGDMADSLKDKIPGGLGKLL